MSPQSSIAHYQIIAKLGEGGMGEVYRATDTKLGREVAVKVLPEAFAQDADRMARFAREAQVLASLNHPHIAAIYGVEDRALIMELVEGPTLAERIALGPVPVDEALELVRQLVDALEYAHEKGVVHRDLKPANIKITPEGKLKVLDFGLAKAMTPDVALSDPMSSPTLTMRATVAGAIMGTAAYMAPEQARGQNVDKRADIWAFGVVVYEMLAGGQLFGGPTVSDTLASVLKEQPEIERVPVRLRKLLRLCLEKDPRKRLRDIGDARVLIGEETAAAPAPAPAAPKSHTGWKACAMGLAVLSLALGLVLWRATRPVARPMMRFSADLGPGAEAAPRVTAAISPDGTRLAYMVRNANGSRQLATRLLDQSKPTILSGTDNPFDPFFSADGQWIGFWSDGKMRKISVQGGAAVALCDASLMRGAAWGEDGYIIVSLQNRLMRVPEAGGQPQNLIRLEEHGSYTDRWPQILPGGKTVLFTTNMSSTDFDKGSIDAMDLKTRRVRVVQRGGYYGRYLPSGHLVYVHQGTLFGVAFDARSLEVKGAPIPLLEDVAASEDTGAGQFDFSRTGTLIYLSGKSTAFGWPILWMDGAGKTQPLDSAIGVNLLPRISPDGKRLAVSRDNDIWIYDPQRSTTQRLTFDGQLNRYPAWTPDGKHLVFTSSVGGGSMWWMRSDGSSQPERILEAKEFAASESFTPDGRTLVFWEVTAAHSNPDIFTLPLDTSDPDHPKPGKPEPFVATDKVEINPAFSPDGRWVAYSSNESGTFEIFVRPFPASASGGKWQISAGGGRYPLWSRSGRELFFESTDGHIMIADYTDRGDSFSAVKARRWSEKPILQTGGLRNYDLAPDGKRIVMFPVVEDSGGERASVHMTVLLNFFDELKRRLP